LLDDAGDDPAVFEVELGGRVVLRDDGRRVEDVFQQVREVGPVRPGDVRADLAAEAVKRVAVLTGLGENRPAEGQVLRALIGGRQLPCPLGDQSLTISRRVADGAPDRGDLRVDVFTAEVSELADRLRRDVRRGDFLLPDRGQQGTGEGGPGGQGRDRVLLFGR